MIEALQEDNLDRSSIASICQARQLTLSIVVATGENQGIGYKNQLPWSLPKDLQFFKKTTLNHIIFMGRKTYQEIGKPLPGRINFVLSQSAMPESFIQPHGWFNHLPRLLEAAADACDENQALSREIMCVGGQTIYEMIMPLASKLYITQVQASPQADRFFPKFNKSDWQREKIEGHQQDERHAYDFSMYLFKRIDALNEVKTID